MGRIFNRLGIVVILIATLLNVIHAAFHLLGVAHPLDFDAPTPYLLIVATMFFVLSAIKNKSKVRVHK